MIDWTTLEPGLVELFRALSGVVEVRWEGAVARMGNPDEGAVVDLLVVSVVGIGQDELLFTVPTSPEVPFGDPWGGVAPLAVETARGWREIVVRAKVTSYLQSPGAAARVYLERIRNRLRWTGSLTALAEMGLGYNAIASSVDLSRVIDGRLRSIAAIDVRFNVISEEINPAGMPTITAADFSPPVEL